MNEENGQPKKRETREIPLDSLDAKGEKTVGELLLAARESAGLHLEDVSLETKIPRRSLEYLETDNFEALPAKVYVRGFLRTYAAILGLDVAYILGKYEVQTGQDHKSRGDHWEIEETVVEEKLESPRIFKRFVIPALLIIVVIIAIWIIAKNIGGGGTRQEGKAETELNGGGVPADGEDETVPEEGRGGSEGDDRSSPESARDDQPKPAKAVAEAAAEEQEDRAIPPMELRIRANDTDTIWFDIVIYTQVDSKPDSIPREFILYPGQQELLRATDSFLFKTIGNAGGFTLERDGVRLPFIGERGRVRKNIRITREGVFRE